MEVAAVWNPKQAQLKQLLLKKDRFSEAMALCLEMHASVHSGQVSGTLESTYEDELWSNLTDTAFRWNPKGRGTTIAWNLWHLSRIEDITANILIADGLQVFERDNWLDRLGVQIRDTGNAMDQDEIKDFSRKLDMQEMKNYRQAVGKRTREILKALSVEDLKRKMGHGQLQRIMDEGGLLEADGSKWLLDFWGRKNVGGILLMPITRHQIVHINDSMKLKEKYMKEA